MTIKMAKDVNITCFFLCVVYLNYSFSCADESVKSSAVVDAVAQLCEDRERLMQQLTDILQVDDTERYVEDDNDDDEENE